MEFADIDREIFISLQLAAHNQEGQSNYSPIATYRTLPDRPDPPAKPRIKGQIQATVCRIVWGKTTVDCTRTFSKRR